MIKQVASVDAISDQVLDNQHSYMLFRMSRLHSTQLGAACVSIGSLFAAYSSGLEMISGRQFLSFVGHRELANMVLFGFVPGYFLY